ncbi:hypothetical protein B0O80DRAFT_62761 [Mortierella sp. GBAus27b]|nr:hypothetical protein B0O80DRAFT_62761 [Mortierella sp. GBAus27b]
MTDSLLGAREVKGRKKEEEEGGDRTKGRRLASWPENMQISTGWQAVVGQVVESAMVRRGGHKVGGINCARSAGKIEGDERAGFGHSRPHPFKHPIHVFPAPGFQSVPQHPLLGGPSFDHITLLSHASLPSCPPWDPRSGKITSPCLFVYDSRNQNPVSVAQIVCSARGRSYGMCARSLFIPLPPFAEPVGVVCVGDETIIVAGRDPMIRHRTSRG